MTMANHDGGTVGLAEEPKSVQANGSVAQSEAQLIEELKAGRISGVEFDRRRAALLSTEYAAQVEEARLATQALYKKFEEGNINRGQLDRELEELKAKQPAATATNGQPPKLRDVTIRQPAAESIVKKHLWLAAGAGALPIPYLDLLAASALQLRMLKQLCDLYSVPFRAEWGKSLISSLVGSTASTLLKGVPGVGLAALVAAPPAFAATTYAMGKVFTDHLESGGTLLSFDPAKTKRYFAEYYNASPNLVTVPA